MALNEFEIAIGGITSIPIVSGLIFLGYKSFGENSLDTSKLKTKKKPAVKNETSSSEKKVAATKNENPEMRNDPPVTIKKQTNPGDPPTTAKEESSAPSKKEPDIKIQATKTNTKSKDLT